jgi:hypothetical protein
VRDELHDRWKPRAVETKRGDEMSDPNVAVVEKAVEQYTTLVELERATGTKTTRARNEILRSLNPADLIAVALTLKGAGLIYGNHK